MAGRLTDKVAIVTGAGGGIGAATTRKLAAEGAAVLCVDVDETAATRIADELAQAGHRAAAFAADLATADANRAMVTEAVRRWGGLDVLHANAAVQVMGSLADTSAEQWQRLFDVNLRGVAWGIEAALPALSERGGGSIVITASLLGIVGDPDMPAYGAMKGGLRALCRSLASAHGPAGIRVNTICPGDVETPLLADFFAFQSDPEAARRAIEERYPLRRFARPEDVANVVAFLASDEAAYLTGIDVVVDGGLLARIY
ncbi:SDR family NAD(P)-dependent oxidoreductase [Conexibacter woesei]|uniref:Short-chain dehydrogenase/reductase SDR n=1 Tax=Conexibacter woesei (strain DSM 14684 / CCUG 47730 / CIP 108061 / JCM 11494 / NBRC 100937 / ID131577) TaxID=469383 RepID=D3F7W9_CONWI|nr:SDR family oxidoreductase [Conexibacter woesei]ADB52863.1 short-chain dehydrogenase/reductase SDR [Conexibacter woesei DSM 14684]